MIPKPGRVIGWKSCLCTGRPKLLYMLAISDKLTTLKQSTSVVLPWLPVDLPEPTIFVEEVSLVKQLIV